MERTLPTLAVAACAVQLTTVPVRALALADDIFITALCDRHRAKFQAPRQAG